MQGVTVVERGTFGWTDLPDAPTQYPWRRKGVKVHWLGPGSGVSPNHGDCVDRWLRVRREHMSDPVNDWRDIAYNYGVCCHGHVFEGRGAKYKSGANGTAALNRSHGSVCVLVGKSDTAPYSAAVYAGVEAAYRLLGGGQWSTHRDGYATECPGSHLHAWAYGTHAKPPPTQEWDEMASKEEIRELIREELTAYARGRVDIDGGGTLTRDGCLRRAADGRQDAWDGPGGRSEGGNTKLLAAIARAVSVD